MQLTEHKLKTMITQVYLEAFEDLINEEPALIEEPQSSFELPPSELKPDLVISEASQSSTIQKLHQLLASLEPDERKRLFRSFGYYTGQHLLSQLNSIKKAEKGDL